MILKPLEDGATIGQNLAFLNPLPRRMARANAAKNP